MNREETKRILTFIASASSNFAKDQDPNMMITAWQIVLGDVSYQEAQVATVKMIRDNKFPSAGALMEKVREARLNNVPTAEEAWTEVIKKLDPYKAPTWSTKTIQEAVRVMGYKSLCASEKPSVDRAQFFKIYNNLLERNTNRTENEIVSQLVGGISAKIGQIKKLEN